MHELTKYEVVYGSSVNGIRLYAFLSLDKVKNERRIVVYRRPRGLPVSSHVEDYGDSTEDDSCRVTVQPGLQVL
jgi:hypothetical protein